MAALAPEPDFVAEMRRGVSVFVASHHGRRNGYCRDLFDLTGLSPETFVISDCGIQHATQDTIADYRRHARGFWLHEKERRVLTTRRDGRITFTIMPGQTTQVEWGKHGGRGIGNCRNAALRQAGGSASGSGFLVCAGNWPAAGCLADLLIRYSRLCPPRSLFRAVASAALRQAVRSANSALTLGGGRSFMLRRTGVSGRSSACLRAAAARLGPTIEEAAYAE